jgi:hypothetical protein
MIANLKFATMPVRRRQTARIIIALIRGWIVKQNAALSTDL